MLARPGIAKSYQMLAIARAIVSEPRMVLIDEPTEGIMPILVEELAALFVRLKAAGSTILLVEQNVEVALSIADQERYCSV